MVPITAVGERGSAGGHWPRRGVPPHWQAMFRRRTDHVFSTLQQVQRRISEQGGTVPVAARPPAPASRRESEAFTPAGQAGPGPGPAPVPTLLPTGFPEPPRPGVVSLPLPLVVVLALLVLALCALCFVLGRVTAPEAVASPGFADGAAGNRVVADAPRAAQHILVVRRIQRPTASDVESLKSDERRMNGAMTQYANRGWQPWFRVDRRDSGAMVLAYGWNGSRWGVDKARHEDLYQALLKSYPSAAWELAP